MTLLAVGHGTRDPAGVAAIRALLARVRAMRPGLAVVESYAEITPPALEDALAGLRPGPVPIVAVPLMLGRGYHARIDIPGRVGPHVRVSRPLGPHPLLAAALAERLGTGRFADAVVLGAAGTSDPAGVEDAVAAAGLLGRRLHRPVRHGFVSAAEPSLPRVVAALRERGARSVAVASYLLAPGHFHDQVAATDANVLAAPLGAHDAVARLVLRRYDEVRTAAPMAGARRTGRPAARAG